MYAISHSTITLVAACGHEVLFFTVIDVVQCTLKRVCTNYVDNLIDGKIHQLHKR